jgi:SAM-dependent methyltransferase
MAICTYCHKELYGALYTSYLQSDPNELLDAAGITKENWNHLHVLDLCGGNGRLALAAKKRGAKVRMVDADNNMCDPIELGKQGIDTRFKRVEVALQELLWMTHPPLFDVVFCQQAINYWLTPSTVKDVKDNMYPEGVFVFNTFNTIPSTVPTFREKNMGDHKEYEAFYLVASDSMVHHVQMREGYVPHKTSFRWISPDEFEQMLNPHFKVLRHTLGRTDIYICRK